MILVGGVGITIAQRPDAAAQPAQDAGLRAVLDLRPVGRADVRADGRARRRRRAAARRCSAAANAWLGWMRGGTAMAAIAGLRGLRRGLRLVARDRLDHGQGRPARTQALQLFAARSRPASLAAGGVLGILIPPSVVLIIYAIIVEANIVTMFDGRADPRPPRGAPLHADHRHLCDASGPRPGPAGRRGRPHRVLGRRRCGVLPALIIFGLVHRRHLCRASSIPTPAAAVGVFAGLASTALIRGQIGLGDDARLGAGDGRDHRA